MPPLRQKEGSGQRSERRREAHRWGRVRRVTLTLTRNGQEDCQDTVLKSGERKGERKRMRKKEKKEKKEKQKSHP